MSEFEVTTSPEEMAERLRVPVEQITQDSKRRNIFAFTPASISGEPPPYVSLNEEPDSSVTITLRGPAKSYETESGAVIFRNDIASMLIPKEELLMMFVGIGSFVYGEEIMCEAAGWFLNKALQRANVVEDVKMTAVEMPAPANEDSFGASELGEEAIHSTFLAPDPE